eukprot:365945-Chlamydomonas_euryale.AAC.7
MDWLQHLARCAGAKGAGHCKATASPSPAPRLGYNAQAQPHRRPPFPCWQIEARHSCGTACVLGCVLQHLGKRH